jgi:shikimate kinase
MNIVFTGFMASGKSSAGKKVSQAINFKFIDTDNLIEERAGMKITDIFSLQGEKGFRDIESEIIKEVSDYNRFVIATGGGVVLSEKNMTNLRKNGIIIYVKCSREQIIERALRENGKRPLFNLLTLDELIKYRSPFYENCDFQVNGDNSLNDVVTEIKDIVYSIKRNKSRTW